MTCFLTQHLRDMLETVRSCSVGAFRSLRYRETDGREKDPHMQLPVRPSILETKKKTRHHWYKIFPGTGSAGFSDSTASAS